VHDASRVRDFLAKKSITKMYQPPYSPDLTPTILVLSKTKKKSLKGQRLADIPNIQSNMTSLL
jgi:transposase